MNIQTKSSQKLNYRIFALMSRLQVEATPVNFELFHELISGANPELRERFSKLGKNITPEKIDGLAREFLPHHFADSAFEQSSSIMRDDLEELLEALQNSRADLETYTKNLGDSSERISKIKPGDEVALKGEIDSITAFTNEQKAKNQAVLGTISRKLDSVNQLSSEMDDVQHRKFTHAGTGLANRRAFNKRMAELFAEDKFPGDFTLLVAKIRNFEYLDTPEMLKAKEFAFQAVGKAVLSQTTDEDFSAWTEMPHISLLLSVAQDGEIERISSVIREQVQAALTSIRRSAPHLPAMTISFGAVTTYAAKDAASMIANANEALAEALSKTEQKTVIFGNSKVESGGANYHLYNR